MPKNQRNTLISYTLFYGGFFIAICSIILIIIYTIGFGNYKGDSFHLICTIFIFTGLTLPFIGKQFNLYLWFGYGNFDKLARTARRSTNTGLIQGIPNNPSNEFLVKSIKNLKLIELEENKKGIYIGTIGNKNVIFDMRWWIRKKYYIYEILMTILQCELISQNNISKKSLYKKIEIGNHNNLSLIIKKNKKNKSYSLVINGITQPSFHYRYRMWKKLSLINYEKYNIYVLYDVFN